MYQRSAVLLASAYAALAGLVADGRLTHADRWAIHHAMPGADFAAEKQTLVGALVPLWNAPWHGAVHIVAELLTLPASFTPAAAIVAVAPLRLPRRPAVALAAAYVFGNVAEVVTKAALTRPPLGVSGFDSSYPSGHAIRAVLVAVAVGAAWPRARVWVAGWASCAIAFIEIGGFHVPSDIAGGLLLTGALLATTWSSLPFGSRATAVRPSPACRPSSRAR